MSYVTVATTGGLLRGIDAAGAVSFLGVPYGDTTSGGNRFRPPQPAPLWTGVRDAFEFGPAAPQLDARVGAAPIAQEVLRLLYPRAGTPTEGGPVSEDCLRLNIWTPSAEEGRGRPVIVWLHGGAYQHGSGNEMAFNGDVLASTQDIVVVTVTHRLGLLGFCALDEVAGESFAGSGVAGLLDIVEALRWVRANIAGFGGDPDSVTICGQSGGGMKVAALMAMPAAAGLFHRAIMQSGPGLRIAESGEGSAIARGVLAMCGLNDASAEQIRHVPLDRLLGVQQEIIGYQMKEGMALDLLERPLPIGPTQHPAHLPGQLFAAGAPEQSANIPLLIGSTAHEMAMMLAAMPGFAELDDAQVAGLAEAAFPGRRGLIAQYRELFPDERPCLLWARLLTDRTFRGGSYQVADAQAAAGAPVFVYLFDQTTSVLGGVLGSCHSLDLPYVFGTVDRIPMAGPDPDRDLANLVMRTWGQFSRAGSPAHDGLPGWPVWSEGKHAMALGPLCGTVDALECTPLLKH
ncbi:MAG TPA: carboxylesterase/lipase family protein [Micromonosporaceae bacterium]|nr:carboxylesterase/lipase family protein [Micromonosporaceae bacterium]HCU48519.1 carboxylesterase/lipase family protein [Micromonosporaceae bacterium]